MYRMLFPNRWSCSCNKLTGESLKWIADFVSASNIETIYLDNAELVFAFGIMY